MSGFSSEIGYDGEYGGIGEFGEMEFEGEYGEFESPYGGASDHYLNEILGTPGAGEYGSPLSEADEMELAAELLEVSSDEELEQFLGSLVKKAVRGVGRFVKSPVGRALGGVLKGVAKKALPVVGGALGSMVAPGIGTAIGSKLGSMASGMFELELEAMPQDEAELEVARRVVGLAASAAKNAATARPRPGVSPYSVARAAVAKAAKTHAPGLHRDMTKSLRTGGAGAPHAASPAMARTAGARPPSFHPMTSHAMPYSTAYPSPGWSAGVGGSGRWVRRGRKIILLGV